MKCEQVQKWILKEDAGELVRWQRSLMKRHVEQCAECRHFRFDLRQIAETTVMTPQPAVDRFAMQILLNEARRVQARREVPSLGKTLRAFFQPLETPSFGLRLAAVTTAVVLLLLTGTVALVQRHAGLRVAWDDGVDQQIERLENNIASLAQDLEGNHPGGSDEESMATQLLAVEG
ncbi:MAG: hypothetical protein EPN23_03290 [Verrucomicrobia bacterium]|nr:MAG: hypothetical protein EPN23_03290 [Verrucomicrobiota bacterium]